MKKVIRSTKESHIKSILKGISWRIIATLTTTIIAYLITGKIIFALEIGGFEFIFKILIYYFHERIWVNIPVSKEVFFRKRVYYQ